GVTARVDVTPVNADQIARFADEEELKDQDPVPLKAQVTNVVEEPGSPKALVVLSQGTEVTKIAQRGSSFLVVFENPQKRGEMLIGWVPERALTSETPVAPKPVGLSCAVGLELLVGDPDFCARVCSDDAACGTEGRCTGSASLAGQLTASPVRFCVAKLEQKAEFVQKPAKASIKKAAESTVSPPRERVSVTPPPVTTPARCSPTCTASCDCSGRPITCSPTCTDTCDCSGRPITCSPTCTDTCDCSGRPRAVARCSPTCTATCDCSGRPITCSPTCTATCDCSGRPIAAPQCSPQCTETCDCEGRPIRCSPTCTETCDCDGRPIKNQKRARTREPGSGVSRKR
ncbi:MAG TPA: hypothetical protein VFU02_13185, partial [Polyangiaceae bacterium]|nr:hypothetical protein [Polyangiaceae bacterium]